MKLIIPLTPPSGNRMRRYYRTPGRYRQLRYTWQRTIWALAGIKEKATLPKPEAGKKIRVGIHVEHKRLYDEDNLVAGCKVIPDVLKRLAFINDDSPDWIDLQVTQEKSPNMRTILTLELV